VTPPEQQTLDAALKLLADKARALEDARLAKPKPSAQPDAKASDAPAGSGPATAWKNGSSRSKKRPKPWRSQATAEADSKPAGKA